MRATFTRKINPETALSLAENLITSIMEEVRELSEEECQCPPNSYPCTCGVNYIVVHEEENGFSYSWDHYGAVIELSFPASDTVQVETSTCGGHLHSLNINVHTGRLRVYHDGARSSVPHSLLCHFPSFWFDTDLCQISEWTRIHLDTSRPDWSVPVGLLRGTYGSGPSCEREWITQEEERIEQEIRNICKVAGIPVPADLEVRGDYENFGNPRPYYTDPNGDYVPWTPNLQGVHYRRLSACGLNIREIAHRFERRAA